MSLTIHVLSAVGKGFLPFDKNICYNRKASRDKRLDTTTGNALYLAHPFFPSTQLCSGCHCLPAIRIDLSIRTYHCEHYGLVIDRDLNATLNLKWLYTASLAELNACGENVRPIVLALTAVLSKQEPSAK